MGKSAMTYRIQDFVVKAVYNDDDPNLTRDNCRAMHNEANIYLILGQHPRIAECLYIGPTRDLIVLKHYPHGNLRRHIAKNTDIKPIQLQKWARQMIEGVAEIHRNGVRHSDIRLDQWLLDEENNARLSDFNASGFDANEELGLEGSKALGLEGFSHYMPRDPMDDSTVPSDLFALGSTLYELEVGHAPFAGSFIEEHGEKITALFEAGKFPEVDALCFGALILGCWKGEFSTALDVLYAGEKSCGLSTRTLQKYCPEPIWSWSSRRKCKTYSSRDSHVVTHRSTNLPFNCLCMAERTGCPVFS